MEGFRTERDSMGEILVPKDALYMAQTMRAVNNFKIAGPGFPRVFIRALGIIKASAAKANAALGLLDRAMAEAIAKAAEEVAAGEHDAHFPLTVYQTGSGTSTNMNANEVIATLANRSIKSGKVHPNDHVNMCQSSNDVIPSAIHISAHLECSELLLPALDDLRETLVQRAAEFGDVVKTGRTHLMDAMPVRLSQVLEGWAHQADMCVERIEGVLPRLRRLALGGTAVGTGVNAHPEFAARAIEFIAEDTGSGFIETPNHFASQSSMDTAAELSAQVRTAACALMKIADDVRWLNSGPLAGLGEITLPALQPGSSIMPGKVNPVMCEALMMACARVMGNDLAVSIANERGNFELNAMLPVLAASLLESITVLGTAVRAFTDGAVAGFTVNTARIKAAVGRNPILVTSLNPVIGYDKAAAIAKRAYQENRPVLDVAKEMTDIPEDELRRLLDPGNLT